jgi:hypothetical protein
MNRFLSSPALLVAWLLCLPAALLTGYLLATPTDLISIAVIGLLFILLATPIVLKWHHPLLIMAWNSYFIVFFLPGQPSLGVTIAAASLGITIVNRAMRKDVGIISIPSVSRPLIFLLIVVLVTAFLTGGVGARALGSANYGGKRYLLLLGAILGYFALTSRTVRPEQRLIMASVFFLSSLTAAVSDIAYAAGPSFYFLFYLVSSDLALTQALSQDTLVRFSGMTWGSLAICYFLVLRYGITGLTDWMKPWRMILFGTLVGLSLLGGFRSALVILGLILIAQFFLEGVHRTKAWVGVVVPAILAFCVLILVVDKLPLSVQRSLSFLPINVDQTAKSDALGTLDWRFEIWKVMVPQIPQYLIVGKGFSFSGSDLWLTQEGIKRGHYRMFEDTVVSGNYHSGPLTIIISFGIFGMLGFLWFCWAALRVLIANYRYGESSLHLVNTFLLSFFIGRLLFFLFLYGQFDLDFMLFTGTLGLSVCLNNGVAQPPVREVELPALRFSRPQIDSLTMARRV